MGQRAGLERRVTAPSDLAIVIHLDERRRARELKFSQLRDPAFYRASLKYSRMYQSKRLQRALASFERFERAHNPESWSRIEAAVVAINGHVPELDDQEWRPTLLRGLHRDHDPAARPD